MTGNNVLDCCRLPQKVKVKNAEVGFHLEKLPREAKLACQNLREGRQKFGMAKLPVSEHKQ